MDPRRLLETLTTAERLKDATRHSYISGGRHESVAEHSWMLSLMAFFLRDEFPDVDMDRVIRMGLIHDLGEAFTGDIPTFDKTSAHEQTEETLLMSWLDGLPAPIRRKCAASMPRWLPGKPRKPGYTRRWTIWRRSSSIMPLT